MKTLEKINKFYLLLSLILISLTILTTFTLKNIFTAINTAEELDSELVIQNLSINGENLDKAIKTAFDRQYQGFEQ
jgi:hypothetical protein